MKSIDNLSNEDKDQIVKKWYSEKIGEIQAALEGINQDKSNEYSLMIYDLTKSKLEEHKSWDNKYDFFFNLAKENKLNLKDLYEYVREDLDIEIKEK